MHLMRILSIIILLLTLTEGVSHGQNLKFGHISSADLIQALPEFATAQSELEKLRKELTDHLQVMNNELTQKYAEYQKNSKVYTDIVRRVKEQELEDMDRRIQEFQNSAQGRLGEKQSELFGPIYGKVEKAIKDVGKENGFLYIFDSNQSDLLYFDKAASTDITNLVKTKLNVK